MTRIVMKKLGYLIPILLVGCGGGSSDGDSISDEKLTPSYTQYSVGSETQLTNAATVADYFYEALESAEFAANLYPDYQTSISNAGWDTFSKEQYTRECTRFGSDEVNVDRYGYSGYITMNIKSYSCSENGDYILDMDLDNKWTPEDYSTSPYDELEVDGDIIMSSVTGEGAWMSISSLTVKEWNNSGSDELDFNVLYGSSTTNDEKFRLTGTYITYYSNEIGVAKPHFGSASISTATDVWDITIFNSGFDLEDSSGTITTYLWADFED
jgi:hypothetical protein